MVSNRPSDVHETRKTQFIDLANLLPPIDQQELHRWSQNNHRDRRGISLRLRRGRPQNNPQAIGKLACEQGVNALPHTDEPSSFVDLNRRLRQVANNAAAPTMHVVGLKDACPTGIKAG